MPFDLFILHTVLFETGKLAHGKVPMKFWRRIWMKFLMEPWSQKNELKHTSISEVKFPDNVLEN